MDPGIDRNLEDAIDQKAPRPLHPALAWAIAALLAAGLVALGVHAAGRDEAAPAQGPAGSALPQAAGGRDG